MALRNNIHYSSNDGKKHSYRDICKSKAMVSFALTLYETEFLPSYSPIYAHKCENFTLSNNCNRALCELHGSNYVSSMSKLVSNKTVWKPVRIVSCKKSVIFSPFYNFLHASNVSIR